MRRRLKPLARMGQFSKKIIPNFSKNNQNSFKIYNTFSINPKNYRYFALGTFAFLLAFVTSAALIPVTNSSAESSVITLTEATGITITNLGNISLTASSPTSSGQIAKASDTVTVDATSAPNGYKLYISTPSTTNTNRLYLSGNTTSPSYIKPNQTNNVDVAYGNETTLAPNSWGFTTTSTNNTNNRYSAVPLYSAPALIASSNTATTANQSVYYAVNANTNLPAGNYTGTVVYTALADIVEQVDTITSITPNYNTNQSSTQQVQIKVTFPVVIDSTASLTNITTTIGGSTCTSPSYALSNDTSGNRKVLTVTCTAPTQSSSGAKDVKVSAEKGSFRYTFQSGTTETKKYYYNTTRGVSLSPDNYTGDASTTTTVTANFPAPVQDLGTTTAQWGSATLSCTNKSTTKNTTYTTLTMTCTIPAQTATTTQALTVTSTEFSGLTQSANFTYTFQEPPLQGNMQDFTNANCDALSTTTNTSDNRIRLQDTRDSKTYKIAKLADGNCWMVQNLALDGGRTLTTADSDVTALRTLASNISNGTSSNNTSVQILSDWANNSGCSGKNCVSGNTEKYGNLYNWYAATATTGTSSLTNSDATDSVCPKGWKLPESQTNNGASSSAPDKSYGKLLYSVLGFSAVSATGSTGGSYVQQMQQAPLWFSIPGYYDSGLNAQGTYGFYWSRKAYTSSSYALFLYFVTNGNLYPQINDYKYRGFSVRCVFDPAPTMQDFTIAQCESLSTTTDSADNRITLADSRDGKTYKIAKLADGDCWMVQNLALDGGRTLTPSDSDVTASRILAPNVSITVSTNNTSVQISSVVANNSGCSGTYCVSGNTEKYGNFYNWYAATATTGTSSMIDSDATDSVCPKGWKLPTAATTDSYGLNAPKRSYSKLLYSVLGFSQVSGQNGSAVQAMQQAPLWFSFPGARDTGAVSNQGTAGLYWSRRAYAGSNSSALYLLLGTSGALRPLDNVYKNRGISVRCVFEPFAPAMQSFTSSQCSALSTTTASADNRTTLRDSRDDKEYKVAKLADGNCWMVQNLALDGGRTLRTSDSDVQALRTLASNISTGTKSNDTSVQIVSAVANNSGCSGTYCVSENTEKYGNLYNWYAATATTGTTRLQNSDANDSVCPKGWKLPTSGEYNTASSSAPDKSYGKLLYSVLGLSAANASDSTGGSYIQQMQQAPLWFSFPGYYDSGLYKQGSSGYYWSRKSYVYTTYGYALRLYFNADDGYLYPQSYSSQYSGFSVRCVFNG